MDKRKCIIIGITTILFILYGVGVYITTHKYAQPEQKYYGLNDTVECSGVSYTLLGMDTCLEEELIDKYSLSAEDVEISDEYKKRYYIACVEVTKLVEDAVLTQMGMYNKYESSYSLEYIIEYTLNNGIININELEVGETIKYYYVKALVSHAFTEETWSTLDESDMWLRFYDDENDYECFMGCDL